MKNLPSWQRWLLHLSGFLIGILIGAAIIFNIFFLSKVLPHGGF